MRWVNALVDYDNIRSSKESSAEDVAINLSIMIPNLTYKIQSCIPDVEEIKFRLYGGWCHKDGQHTFQCGWLMGEMSKINIRYGKVRAKCQLARELVARNDLQLKGTYRDKGQKMVDEMITADLIQLAAVSDMSLALISDDDDFVPGIITSSIIRNRKDPLIVLRPRRKTDTAINDHLLDQCNVTLAAI